MDSLETFRFGSFCLAPAERQLLCDGVPVELGSRAFDLLLALVRRNGRLATKDDLMTEVWPRTVVEENNLQAHISTLRKVLARDAHGQNYLLTVPGHGYRFVAEVTRGSVSSDAVADPGRPAAQAAAIPAIDGASVRRPDLPLPDRPSIAVMPFANLSSDPDQEHVADGLCEDLITGLARIRWLFVIARNSSFMYKGDAIDIRRVSRELGVRYVLEGSVRRAGSRLRITGLLIDATTLAHHWAERYDRELGDIFAVQDEITRSVAAAIEPRLLAAEGVRALARSPDDLGAWENVARAQTHLWRLTWTDCEAAIAALARVAQQHPDYAPARGLLGFSLAFAAHMGWIEQAAGLVPAREHATRAIGLDDSDPSGHIALGYCAMMERRTGESLASLRRAVVLHPNSAAAHAHLSRGLAFAGEDRDAIAHGEEAIRLSPLDPDMALFLGGFAIAHFAGGRYAQAAEYAAEAARLRPGFYGVQRMRCACLAAAGHLEEARALLAVLRREQPQLTMDWLKAIVPYQTPELRARYLAAMENAGLCETD